MKTGFCQRAMEIAENKELEEAIFKWFFSAANTGKPSFRADCKKPKLLSEIIKCLSSSKVSNNWLQYFKARPNPKAAENFIENSKLEQDLMTLNFYMAHMRWKSFPEIALASKSETSAPDHKVKLTKDLGDSYFVCEGYYSIFLPGYKKYHNDIGKEGSKVMFIVGNAAINPTEILSDTEDRCFKTLFLPKNITFLLQPLGQLAIETKK
ncbi:jerky protein homolog-like [Schistocerca americana]|uniref:jerky protein homolog-like n=1 Tax=Schistocerca americana TaxID=7009 RepID=UPI001F4FCC6F|nr:jerky protein homolog-like [Schistocerca americana]